MRLIVNVLLLLAAINLGGCSALSLFSRENVKPVEIQTKPIERAPLAIQEPQPLRLPGTKWIIITKENSAEVFSSLENSGVDPVIFGLTDDGYKDLSIMFSEIRNFISTQRTIISKYKEYYEPPKDPNGSPVAPKK